MISQLWIQSMRGDVIIYKDFRGNIAKNSTDIFFRKASLWEGEGRDAPPVLQADGVHFLHVRSGGLFWVASTRENVSPSLVLELLMRLYWIVRDYVGHVSEESVRRNFLLVYELLDEVLDFGFPQNSSTDRLKEFVAMEPIVMKPHGKLGLNVLGPAEVVKSVLDTARTGAKEEIFVDIVEKLTAIFDAGGHLRSSSIAGSIQIKSYISGNPRIRLGLSDGIILGKGNGKNSSYDAPLAFSSDDYGSSFGGSSNVILDSYSLHEAVDSEVFDRSHVLELTPPEGHFNLLNYRCSQHFRPPFRIYPLLEDDPVSPDKLTLYIKLRAEFETSKLASGVEVTIPLPASVERVHCETDSTISSNSSIEGSLLGALSGRSGFQQKAEWYGKEHRLVWSLRNLRGGKEHTLRARLTVDSESVGLLRQDYGPIMVQFVLPGKPSASGLDVKYLKILREDRGTSPSRWFRVVALANSYQVRTG